MACAVKSKQIHKPGPAIAGFFFMCMRKIVCIAGLGLVGGSMAIDLRKRGFASHIIGVEENPVHQRRSQELGLVDEFASLETAVRSADLVILATPVDVVGQLLPAVLDLTLGKPTVVTDTGSTKSCIIDLIKDHPNRPQFVAGHPMAGTEYSGPDAASGGLFDQKCAIICDPHDSNPEAVAMVEEMYHVLQMPVIRMEASQHDVSAAYVSHISHIVSFALSLCVQEKKKNEKRIMSLAGGGFASTVRLAASKSSTWAPIFLENATPVLEALDAFMGYLQQFRNQIALDDREKISQLIQQANHMQKIIN